MYFKNKQLSMHENILSANKHKNHAIKYEQIKIFWFLMVYIYYTVNMLSMALPNCSNHLLEVDQVTLPWLPPLCSSASYLQLLGASSQLICVNEFKLHFIVTSRLTTVIKCLCIHVTPID